MFETVKNSLASWNQSATDKQKLQHTYVVLLAITVFIAGIVALFNGNASRLLMYVALAFITTFLTNFVVWSLLKTTVLDKLPKPTRNKR